MREIVMDTETTGLDCLNGDRLVEIAGIELNNYIPTGRVWHQYINPERDMPRDALAVHGLTTQFLSTKPVFASVVPAFMAFVEGAKLIFHNASFDIGFINAELARLEHPPIAWERVVDTLALARRKHPAGPNSLDALCKRYGIDNSARTRHGALLDAELLAEVYLQLSGGHQPILELTHSGAGYNGAAAIETVRIRETPLPVNLDKAEIEAHAAFIKGLGKGALWELYGEAS